MDSILFCWDGGIWLRSATLPQSVTFVRTKVTSRYMIFVKGGYILL